MSVWCVSNGIPLKFCTGMFLEMYALILSMIHMHLYYDIFIKMY